MERPLSNGDKTTKAAKGAQLAVALRADTGLPPVLRVIAQASGPLAEQMRALAAEHKVEIREDRDLAALVAAVELDQEIPVEALATIGAILTQLYHANDRTEER